MAVRWAAPLDRRRCAICLTDFEEEGAALTRLPCGHHFHGDCIGNWLKRCSTCPLCKAVVSTQGGAQLRYVVSGASQLVFDQRLAAALQASRASFVAEQTQWAQLAGRSGGDDSSEAGQPSQALGERSVLGGSGVDVEAGGSTGGGGRHSSTDTSGVEQG